MPDIKHPRLSAAKIREIADNIRNQFGDPENPPVDVLAIAEFDLNIKFKPVTGLKEGADIDALLLGDWKTIIVDHQQYLDSRYENRMRYSVAHEIGHWALHEECYKALPRATVGEWMASIDAIPEDEYAWIEWQAYEFAGRFLVPLPRLTTEFESAVQTMEAHVGKSGPLEEAQIDYLCKPIAKVFSVSDQVIKHRLIKEGLWIPAP